MSTMDDLMTIVGDAGADEIDVPGWLSTGFPVLNKILSGRYDGGIGYGRLYEIYGPSSSGKTVIAANLMIEAQRAGGAVVLVDYEQAFMTELSIKNGLNPKPPHFIHLKPMTWEEGMMKALKLGETIRERKVVEPSAPVLVVVDSIAAGVPQSVMEKELDAMTMNDSTALARATSNTLRVIAPRSKRSSLTFVFLNQVREKPGVSYGPSETTPGGKSMEFYASARIALSRARIMEKGDAGDKEMAGQLITAKCVKSKHTRPFGETEIYFLFDEFGSGHFDVNRSLIKHLTKVGKIAKSGARLTWIDGKSYFEKQLSEKVDKEGLQGELQKLLEAK